MQCCTQLCLVIDHVHNELICFSTRYRLNFPTKISNCPCSYFVINKALDGVPPSIQLSHLSVFPVILKKALLPRFKIKTCSFNFTFTCVFSNLHDSSAT